MFEQAKKMTKILWVTLITLSVPMTFSQAGAWASERTATIRAIELAEKVDAVVEKAREAGAYPGIAISISRNGKTVYAKGYGVTDIESGAPVTAETIFPIGSVTKSFTSLAIAQLAADGAVDLEAPIGEYFADLPEGWEGIKIRQLMNHTSGMFDYTDDNSIQEEPFNVYDTEQMRAFWETVPLAFEPGTQWSYTNSGYYLLGRIIEQASGMSYTEYLETYIFSPFGMENTVYPNTIEGKPGAKGYIIEGRKQIPAPNWSASIPFSAGALLSTVGDLAKYAQGVHHSKKTGRDIRQIIYSKEVINRHEILYSLGGLSIQSVEGRRKLSHPGSIWGYTSHFAHYPDENVTISVLTNGDGSSVHPSNIERKLARIAFGVPQPVYRDAPLTETQKASIIGDYSTLPMSFISSDIGFVERSGAIFMVYGGLENEIFSFPLRHVGGGKFVAYHDDELVVQFDDIEGKAMRADYVFFDGQLSAHRKSTD